MASADFCTWKLHVDRYFYMPNVIVWQIKIVITFESAINIEYTIV